MAILQFKLLLVLKNASRVTKPEAGHFVKAGVEAGRGLWEFRTESEEFTLGQEINVDIFTDVKKVDVTGTSKGKGFQRWCETLELPYSRCYTR